MRPNAPLSRPIFVVAFVVSVAVCLCVLLRPIPALDGNSPRSLIIRPFAVAVQGASPLESLMPQRQAVLRRVVLRKPVAFLQHPDRDDAKNYLGVYVVETLECGHKTDVFFNPPIENLTAKYRRCRACDEAEKVIEITAGKKKPCASVGIAAPERKRIRS